ncbi:MAG TPA: MBL fold metallo-hydrolase [Gaiellaceae bacterium]|jgi:phosphoribosyl 1,2-cyclic phosphodiesterase|nr:MBL fold metallo-hydrolase [Gaiellaceae bacterium]
MRLKIWGCRGSVPTPGPSTVKDGGNTSCVALRPDDDTLLILDAGTGIRELGKRLNGLPKDVHILLTHLHLDHIEGLRFFAPLWRRETSLTIWGPASPVRTLRDRIRVLLSPPLFPIHLGDVPARLTFRDAPAEMELGAARITSQRVQHPGPTVGYRIQVDGRTLAYIPDHEPALGLDLETVGRDWVSGLELAEGADWLLHDAQYFEEEYPALVGWGHSSVAHAVTVARHAEARRLVLFHHDPAHDDADLERLEARARELAGEDVDVYLAREGLELSL